MWYLCFMSNRQGKPLHTQSPNSSAISVHREPEELLTIRQVTGTEGWYHLRLLTLLHILRVTLLMLLLLLLLLILLLLRLLLPVLHILQLPLTSLLRKVLSVTAAVLD